VAGRGRPKQLPPPGEWATWLIMAGRGWGKSWVGSNWLAEQAVTYPGTHWAVCAPTFNDVRHICIEGPTGLLAAFAPGELLPGKEGYHKNEAILFLTNGSVIRGFSGDNPERLRGPNLAGAWFDELGAIRYEHVWYETLVPAVRDPRARAQITVTTTPRPTSLIRDLVSRNDGTVHVTRGTTWENAANLAPSALGELRRRYEGSRIGRQELEGELIETVEGTLWHRDWLDAYRIGPAEVPDLTRVIIALDPATTSTSRSDEFGIIVAGEADGHGYVLEDLSMRGSPAACMKKAVAAYHRHKADRVIAEANQGGDFIGGLLATIDPSVPFRKVSATRGKAVRAEPVSSQYEQGRIHHVGIFPELEDELYSWTPADPKSPGRLDATVWAFTELKLSTGSFLEAMGLIMCPSQACGQGMHTTWPDGTPRTHCIYCATPLPDSDGGHQGEPGRESEPPAQQTPQPAWPVPPQLAGLAAYGARPPSPAQPARVEDSRGGSYRQIGSIRVWD
jgi:phage terminase large subunit-like protein